MQIEIQFIQEPLSIDPKLKERVIGQPEILAEIFRHLSDIEFIQSQYVCKNWYEAIKHNRFLTLRLKITQLYSLARRYTIMSMQSTHRPLKLRDVVKFIAKFDLSKATRIAEEIKQDLEQNEVLTIIAVRHAEHDLSQAFQIAGRIEHPYFSAIALASIARRQSKSDPAGASATYDRAFQIAKNRFCLAESVDALVGVAVQEMKSDTAAALEIFDLAIRKVEEVDVDFLRAQNKVVIASQLAKLDLPKARQIADELDDFYGSEAFAAIAVHQVKSDVRSAFATAEKVNRGECSAKALAAMAAHLSKVDMLKARNTIGQSIEIARNLGDIQSAETLVVIASKQAKFDLEEALSTARSIESAPHLLNTLAKIAVQMAKLNPFQSLDLMNAVLQNAIL